MACHFPMPWGVGMPRRLSSAAIARREVAPPAWIVAIIGWGSAAGRSARSCRTTALRAVPLVRSFRFAGLSQHYNSKAPKS